jgi:hypothetical protein
VGLLVALVYIGYLVSIGFYQDMLMIFTWLMFGAGMELIRLVGTCGNYEWKPYVVGWKIFDEIRYASMICYLFFCAWEKPEMEGGTGTYYQTLSFAALNFVSWIGLLQYLRFSKYFRVFINILINVVQGLFRFFIVLGILLFAFMVTFYFRDRGVNESWEEIWMDNMDNDNRLLTSFTIQWRAMFGEFTTDDFDWWNWAIFVLMTIALSLVMMNLMFAVILDTYDKVMSNMERSQYKELSEISYELELLMFWNFCYKKDPKHIVFACTNLEAPDWTGTVRETAKIVETKLDLVHNSMQSSISTQTAQQDAKLKTFDMKLSKQSMAIQSLDTKLSKVLDAVTARNF